MKMWVFKELRIHYLEEHLAHGERHLKCGLKGKSVLARLKGGMVETCFWWERLPESSSTVQGRTGRYRRGRAEGKEATDGTHTTAVMGWESEALLRKQHR